MSCSYADGLSPYENKGKLGLEEKFDNPEKFTEKVSLLAEWIEAANHVVIHTGAGISTAAGIPDFRGPKGVWTLEKKGLKPEMNVSFDDATPTLTHMALLKLVEEGKVHYIVSQNIDGLHLRSGVPRDKIAELHGNMFTEECNQCNKQFVRKSATTSVGRKCLNTPCPSLRLNGRPCRGKVYDTILDWEDNLPDKDLVMADFHSCVADLSICLGTTLQIVPSGNLPLYSKKYGGRLVICNLQPTKHDRKADLIIHGFVDDILSQLMKLLEVDIPSYDEAKDPTKMKRDSYIEWTICGSQLKHMRKMYEEKCCRQVKKRSIRSVCKNNGEDVSVKQEKSQKLNAIENNCNGSVKQEIEESGEVGCSTLNGVSCVTSNSAKNGIDVNASDAIASSPEEHNTDGGMSSTQENNLGCVVVTTEKSVLGCGFVAIEKTMM